MPPSAVQCIFIVLLSGDDGLKRLFKKIYKLLNEGGMFILEPQPFHGYKRRKNLTVSRVEDGFSGIFVLVVENF